MLSLSIHYHRRHVVSTRVCFSLCRRFPTVHNLSVEIQKTLLLWSLDGHSTFWTTSDWCPGLSPFMSVLKRAKSATESKVWDAKGMPPDRAWFKRRIAQYLNDMARREIQQREASQHLTAYLLEFKRGQFPGKYLHRAPASRLSQFAASHFPCRQYLKRFGISDDTVSCDCGHSCEDRDHLLLDCPRFSLATRHLVNRLEAPSQLPESLTVRKRSRNSSKL